MTSEEINLACIERLRSTDLTARVVVVGSGLSSPLIAPLGTLKETLCERCRIDKGADDEFFWILAQRAFTNDPNEYYKVIEETYGEPFPWKAEAYNILVKMPFLGFATLNYDSQFWAALQEFDPDALFSIYPPFNDQNYFNPEEFSRVCRRLIALHGYCDPDNPNWAREVILKTDDYKRHYVNPGALRQWWISLLVAKPCLFIGTTLQEPGLLHVVESMSAEHRDRLSAQKHLQLIPAKDTSPDSDTAPPATTWGLIEQVPYLPRDKYHRGLLQVLSEVLGVPFRQPGLRMPNLGRLPDIGSMSKKDFDFTP